MRNTEENIGQADEGVEYLFEHEDDGLDDWGNDAEKYEVNGITVNVYRYPIIGMRLGAKDLERHTASREERTFYQYAYFISVMSDGETYGGDGVPSSDMLQSEIFPAPPNSYHVVFYAPKFEDLIIGDKYEFNGIRGNWEKHIRSSVELYLQDRLAEVKG